MQTNLCVPPLDLRGYGAQSFPFRMSWAVPQYSREEIDVAGRILVDPASTEDAIDLALAVINNWRSSHSFPLNTFQVGLRRKVRTVDAGSLVAQRIKRISSIHLKLQRLKSLTLSEIQDIGGCRAVVRGVREVREVVSLYKSGDIKHRLVDEDDYTSDPKRSGYRGYHLIYRYYSDKKTTYNGLKIEIQIRSPLQHAWATAVETVSTFTRQALKSSQGGKDWLRFFALMGSAIALRERTPIVPKTPVDKKELFDELRQLAAGLDVVRRLTAYGEALQEVERPSSRDSHYFLLALDPEASQLTITGFAARELERAASEYLATERALAEKPGGDAVLVKVESLAALRRAYPNYFLDTKVFVEEVRRVIAAKV